MIAWFIISVFLLVVVAVFRVAVALDNGELGIAASLLAGVSLFLLFGFLPIIEIIKSVT